MAGLLATTLAAGLLGNVPAHAVAGGAALDASYRFVVKIEVGDRSCSGALIDPRWVVTASHCFPENDAAGAPKVPTTATVGRPNLDTAAGHVVNVIHLVPRTDRNLVLAKLARPVTDVPPIKVATNPPDAGEVLRVAGYGRTATEWVPDLVHAAQFSVQSVSGATFGVTGSTPDASICKGDAGGPAFRAVDDSVELVAINHTSWQRGCFGEAETREGATETRVDDLGDWIRANTRELAPDDFDGDGKADLLGWDTSGDQLWSTPNTSTVGKPSRGASVRIATGWRTVGDQRLADYDSDGRADIIGRSGDSLLVWLNTSTVGRPSYAPYVSLGTGWSSLGRLAVTDFDGDGRADLLGYNATGDELWFAPNTSTVGKPSSGAREKLASGWRTVKGQTLVDYDGDGMTDIVGRVGELMVVWLNTSTVGKPSYARYVTIGDNFDTLPEARLGDFDGDGRPDIVGYDASGDQLWFIPNTSTAGKPSKGASVKVSVGWRTVTDRRLADYDGDGKLDLVGRSGDSLLVWVNTSSARDPSHTRYASLGTGWNSIGKFLTSRPRF